MKCPSEECHENIHGHIKNMKKTLYGESGAGGLVAIMGKKISINTAIAFLVFALTFSGSFILYAIASDKTKTKDVAKNTERVIAIEVQMQHIQQSICTVKSDQQEIRKSIQSLEKKQITKQEIYDTVKDALKND